MILIFALIFEASHQIRKCRQETQVESRTFNATVCVSKPGSKCVDFERIECKKKSTPQTVNIDYKTQELRETTRENKTHCLDQTFYNCEDRLNP